MTDMIYRSNRTMELLDEGEYKDWHYMIISYGTHPCAYIEIPQTHMLYDHCNEDKYINDELLYDIDCHGGITYASDTGFGYNTDYRRDGHWLGWDYDHAGDFNGFSSAYSRYRCSFGEKKWSTAEIFGEVRDTINQLIIMDGAK